MDSSKAKILIYTDGACLGNPGKGGYATLLRSGSFTRTLSGGYRLTTNNRMELLSVILGLEAIKKRNLEIFIYSDSKYVVHAVEKGWLIKWVSTDFKDKKNVDLWKRFWGLYQIYHPKLLWIKGHDGHIENEHCDAIAVASAQKGPWKIDEHYEKKNIKTL